MGILSSIGNKIKSAVQSIVHPSSTSKSGSTSSTSSASTPVYEKTNEDTLQEYNGTDMDSGSYADESTTSSGSISGFFKKAWNTVKKGAEKVADFFKKDSNGNTTSSSTQGNSADDNKNEGIGTFIKNGFHKLWSRIKGTAIDIFDENTKDGKIGNTQQHSTGDCWLLSGVNALSYTEKGREIIKDALEYCKDGSVKVHLKGVGKTYTITRGEIAGTKGCNHYSSGDDDMIALELAVEKALDDIANGEIAVDPRAPQFLEDRSELNPTLFHESSTKGGKANELFYLLTGKRGTNIDANSALDIFMENGNKEFAMGASTKDSVEVKDVNGEVVKLAHPHAYAVKKVDKDTVTITNPWDSGKDIVLSRETFVENFTVDACDLADDTPIPQYISTEYTLDENGNKVYKFNHKESESLIAYGVRYDITEEVYSPNGTRLKTISKDKNGNIGQVIEYNPDGSKKSLSFYDSNGTLMSREEFDEKGNLQSNIGYHENGKLSHISKYDKAGNIQSCIGYHENGVISYSYEYDEEGNPIKQITYDEDGNITEIIKYDKNGNRIK